MNIIDKITRSIRTFKEILDNEWDVSSIPDLSNQEIERIYNIPSSKSKSITQFGIASGCNFTVRHKHIPDHHLHIIYYNFPEVGKVSSKVTKSSCDKIKALYINELIKPFDSIIVVINDTISHSLETSFQELNINLQNEIEHINLDKSIIKKMKDNNFPLEKKHFRNVTLLSIDSITNNLFKHRLVPKHTVIRSRKEIQNIIQKLNVGLEQLPIILKNDAIAKQLLMVNGDICEITRSSMKSGEYNFYRICQ